MPVENCPTRATVVQRLSRQLPQVGKRPLQSRCPRGTLLLLLRWEFLSQTPQSRRRSLLPPFHPLQQPALLCPRANSWASVVLLSATQLTMHALLVRSHGPDCNGNHAASTRKPIVVTCPLTALACRSQTAPNTPLSTAMPLTSFYMAPRPCTCVVMASHQLCAVTTPTPIRSGTMLLLCHLHLPTRILETLLFRVTKGSVATPIM